MCSKIISKAVTKEECGEKLSEKRGRGLKLSQRRSGHVEGLSEKRGGG
jgi:hypothetical protein